MIQEHSDYIKRCFVLARRGGKHVKSNPHVGALLVFEDRIIGEGWHQQIGGAHAEVNAIASVADKDQHLIEHATLYVSLEPCNRYGRTGPCSELILKHRIKHVVVSSLDPTIGGESLEYLESKGVKTEAGICADEGGQLIGSFVRNTEDAQPYVILKYAQSHDFYMAKPDEQFWISNAYSKVLAHKWRSEIDGILIGVNTLLIDNPQLNSRLYPGDSPLPIIIDPALRSNPKSKLFQNKMKPLIFTNKSSSSDLEGADIIKIDFSANPLDQILSILFKDFNICRLMVEGGVKTLNSFIAKELWDEARIIRSPKEMKDGQKAPTIVGRIMDSYSLADDKISIMSRIR